MQSAETIRKFLEEDDWKYQVEKENEDVVIFRMGIRIDGKLARCDIRIICEEDRVISLANIGVFADEKRYAEAAEFITRVNYELANMSKFEMDFRDGEIRACYEVDCGGEMQLTEDVVEGIVYLPANMFDRYGNALLDVLFGYATPEEAVERLIERLQQSADEKQEADDEVDSKPMWNMEIG